MGKLKVSFTTALFVFSFLVCVVVAVVFVDSGRQGDRDSFYEDDRAGEAGERRNDSADGTGADAWAKRKEAAQPAPTATPTAQEALLADLPIDPHLVGAAQPIPAAAAAPAGVQPTANPHAGQSPEQIARALMGAGGVPVPAPQATAVPGMAIPGGIATPAQQTIVTATPQAAIPQKSTYLPLQSNVSGDGVGGAGSSFPSPGGFAGNLGSSQAAPSLSGATNMSGSGWDAVSGKPTPDTMIGVRAATGGSDAGMMISRGKSAASEPPLGFEPSITSHGAAPAPGFGGTGASPAGDAQAPLLFPPGGTPASGNKWDLPPVPTLRPPPIQDPDQRRSDADSPESGSETPDSANQDGSSGQALAVSSTTGTSTVESAEPDAIAARVNEVELTENEAARLAQVAAKLAEEDVTQENRQEKITEAVRNWTTTIAAAEQARKQNLSLSNTEVDRYAAMRPDFDIDPWKKSMAEVGFTKAEIEKHLEAIALGEKLVEESLEKKYPEEELKKVYEKTPKEFYAPRQVHVQEIFKARPDDDKQVKRVVSEISRLQRQAAGGTDFGLLARTTSEAPSKAKGGDLGWITPEEDEKTKTELVKAVADLKPGQISQVVESEDGFRIYKVVAEKEARDTFEGARELVVEKLKKEIRKDALASARDESEVELAPKKEIKVAEAKSDDKKSEPSKKENSSKDSSTKSAAVNASPQRPIQHAAANGQLLYAPGTPMQQREGGAPAPPVQPGGQLPVQQRMAVNASGPDMRSYSPGQTMVVGGDQQEQAAANPAVAQQINYAAPLSVGAVATPDPNLTPEQQALQLRALQARTQQEEQARNAEVEAQLQAARGRQAQMQSQQQLAGSGAGTVMPGGMTGNASQGTAVTPELPGRPVTTHSNGWQVTKNEIDSHQAAAAAPQRRQAEPQQGSDDGITIPPGFEGNTGFARQQGQQAAAQPQQPQAEQEREGGFFSGVRNLFSRER